MRKRVCGALLCALMGSALWAATAVPAGSQRRLAFNDGWRFFKGEAAGAEAPGFQDSSWTEVLLPHDWAIEGPFDSTLNPHTGALPIFGAGWYRKAFTLPATAKDRYIGIEFDGAMANSTVWLNGHQLGGRPYGYIGFSFDLTPYLEYGAATNVIAVRLTPEDHSSRWYPGAGIYRNVWLDVTGPLHVARWGTYVTTPEVSDDKASVSVKTELRNRTDKPAELVLQSEVLDPAGKPVSRNTNAVTIPAGGSQTQPTVLTVNHPQRWDIDHPYMYTLVSEVLENQKVVDRYETPFGIRTIAFDKQKGFLLNGRARKIQGVCNHHDLGALGAAVSRRATERQLQIMKSAGVNAIRTSHNPPSPELLEFCDRLGLVVMDESFDMWKIAKVPNGYSKYFDEWSERDVRDMVHRDRNHPSIVMYSIGIRDPRAGPARRRCHGPSPDGFLPRRRSHPPHHFGLQRLAGGHPQQAGRRSGSARLQLPAHALRADPQGASQLGDLRLGNRVVREFPRHLPPAHREVREASLVAALQLRHHCA